MSLEKENTHSSLNVSERSRYRWFVLALLFTTYLFNFVDRQIFAILQEPIKRDLNLSDTQLGLLGGLAFALFYTAVGIPVARLADTYNRTWIMSASLAVWSFMTAMCGAASGFVSMLAARIGVGVGESGCSPSAHSIISDYFPAEQRSTALGIYSAGIPVGVALGYIFGGYINDALGWREAFILVGLPGVVLAILLPFLIREPQRGMSDKAPPVASESPPPFVRSVSGLLQNSTFVHVSLAAALHAFVSYGTTQWLPSFFIRSWGMSTGELSIWLGLVSLTAGAASAFLGGWLADRLGKKDKRWYFWLPAITVVLMLPFYYIFLFQSNWRVGVVWYAGASFLSGIYLGPTFSIVQGLLPTRMRSLGVAVLLFVLNLIGMGLGPLAVGILSDVLEPVYGNQSIKLALLSVSVVNIWSCAHYFLAARSSRSANRATEPVYD